MAFLSMAAVQTRADGRAFDLLQSTKHRLVLFACCGVWVIAQECLGTRHFSLTATAPSAAERQKYLPLKELKPAHETRPDLTRNGIWTTLPITPNWVCCGVAVAMSTWCGTPVIPKSTLITRQQRATMSHSLPPEGQKCHRIRTSPDR